MYTIVSYKLVKYENILFLEITQCSGGGECWNLSRRGGLAPVGGGQLISTRVPHFHLSTYYLL